MIPRVFIDTPLKGALRRHLTPEALWQAADLPLEVLHNRELTLDNSQYSRMMKQLWQQTDDELMGMAPVSCRYGTFSMLCKAVISCQTLEHAMHRANTFMQLFDGYPTTVLHKGKHVSDIVIQHSLDYDPDRFLAESLLTVWHRFPSWLVDQGIPLLQVGCCYAQPAHADLYQQIFATPVLFDQPQTYLRIPTRVLSLPIMQTPASLHRFLQHSPMDFLARPNPHQSVSGQVRQRLRNHDIRDLPTLNQMAQTLHMSSATLRRRLSEEGTAFQQLKDHCRMEQAALLLQQAELSIREIAEQVGYTEASTFHRAFKKWQGTTPGAYRTDI